MKLNIIKQNKNSLLSRNEIKAELTFQGPTPKTEDIKKSIAALSKSDENLILVKGIYNEYGNQKASINAYIYDSEKEMKNIEKKPKKQIKAEKKKAETAAKPAEEKPAAAPKKETPIKEPKQEKKAEENKKEKPEENKK